MDDRRAALLLALLALAGAGVRWALAPANAAAPGDVRLVSLDTPPSGGLRATARLCGVSLNTALRFARRAGDHAREFHDQLVRHVEVHQVQAAEAWAFVGKKRQAV